LNLFETLVAARDPEALFLERPGGLRETYGDLIAHTARLAQVLVALGVRPGDRVAVQVEKSAEALHLYLACLRAGAVYLPLNTAYTLAELAYFIADAEPALIVCDPAAQEATTPLAEHVGARVATLDAEAGGSLMSFARSQAEAFETVPRAPDDLAAILYTSGTTGRSKGAMLTHANLESNARTLAELWRFTPADVLIHALPIYHIHGLFVATNVVLAAGASMILRPRFEPQEVIGLFGRASVLMGVPTFYTRLLARPELAREGAGPMRLFVSGSAPLLAETHRQWEARTGHTILERYGMTETGMNASNPYEGERRAGSVGLALPGVSIRIADEQGRALPSGQIGMIEVRGPNLFQGYWRMPEKTAEDFRDGGWFVTGDLGVLDPDGYLSIVGRGKDLVISAGLNVYPKEVEAEIDALPGVLECAVIGLPHPDLGEAVTAVVAAGSDAPDEAEVISALTGRLARFKQPKRVIFVADLPRNAMGKVQKARLRELYADLYR
jgi:malonyl-CoA/methylmalonyl-CoA synthetase